MTGRNNRVIVDALDALAHAMGQQQQADGGDHGLDRFLRNKPPTFKGKHDPEGAQTWLQDSTNQLEEIQKDKAQVFEMFASLKTESKEKIDGLSMVCHFPEVFLEDINDLPP